MAGRHAIGMCNEAGAEIGAESLVMIGHRVRKSI